MFKLKPLVFLALGMEIDAADSAHYLIEADVVEPFETSARNLANAVVWDEERLFPAHEDVLPLRAILVVEIWFFGLLRQRAPGREASPVVHVGLVRGSPRGMASLKRVFGTDDFSLKIGRKCWMVIGQAFEQERN